MEGDVNIPNVLGFLEVVRDAPCLVVIRPVKDIHLARPARVSRLTAFTSVEGHSAASA